MAADPADLIRAELATGGQGGAWRALELALADAQEAGLGAITANPQLPPAEQFALALQAADEALEGLEGLAAELAWNEESDEEEGAGGLAHGVGKTAHAPCPGRGRPHRPGPGRRAAVGPALGGRVMRRALFFTATALAAAALVLLALDLTPVFALLVGATAAAVLAWLWPRGESPRGQ